jgi:predicted MFS family arabinose efflux permease
VFYILAGVAIIPMTAAFWALPSYRPDPRADKRVDLLGALLSTGGLVMLLYVMTAGPTAQEGFRTPCECDIDFQMFAMADSYTIPRAL